MPDRPAILFRWRWPDGFRRPRCGGEEAARQVEESEALLVEVARVREATVPSRPSDARKPMRRMEEE